MFYTYDDVLLSTTQCKVNELDYTRWTETEISGEAPPDTAYFKCGLQLYSTSAQAYIIYIDDAFAYTDYGTLHVPYYPEMQECVADIAIINHDNILDNPTLDYNINHWSTTGDAISAAYTTLITHSGPGAAQLYLTADPMGGSWLTDFIAVDSDNVPFEVSCYMYATSGNPPLDEWPVQVVLYAYDNSETLLDRLYADHYPEADSWKFTPLYGTLPVGTAFVKVGLEYYNDTTPFGRGFFLYVDDWRCTYSPSIQIHLIDDIWGHVWRIDLSETAGAPIYNETVMVIPYAHASSIARAGDILFIGRSYNYVSVYSITENPDDYLCIGSEKFPQTWMQYLGDSESALPKTRGIKLYGAYVENSTESMDANGQPVSHYVLLHQSVVMESLIYTDQANYPPGYTGYILRNPQSVQSTIVYINRDHPDGIGSVYFCAPIDTISQEFVWYDTMNISMHYTSMWTDGVQHPALIMWTRPNNYLSDATVQGHSTALISYLGADGLGSLPVPFLGRTSSLEGIGTHARFISIHNNLMFIAFEGHLLSTYTASPCFAGGPECGWRDITSDILSVNISSEAQEEGVSYMAGSLELAGDHSDIDFLRLTFGEADLHRAAPVPYAPGMEEEFTIIGYVIQADRNESYANTTSIQFSEWLGTMAGIQGFTARDIGAAEFGWDRFDDMSHVAALWGTWKCDNGALVLDHCIIPNPLDENEDQSETDKTDWAIAHSTYMMNSANGTVAVHYTTEPGHLFGVVFRSLGDPRYGRYVIEVQPQTDGTAILYIERQEHCWRSGQGGTTPDGVGAFYCWPLVELANVPLSGWMGVRFKNSTCWLYFSGSFEELFSESALQYTFTNATFAYRGFVGLIADRDASKTPRYLDLMVCSMGRLYNSATTLKALLQFQKPTSVDCSVEYSIAPTTVVENGTVPHMDQTAFGSLVYTTTQPGVAGLDGDYLPIPGQTRQFMVGHNDLNRFEYYTYEPEVGLSGRDIAYSMGHAWYTGWGYATAWVNSWIMSRGCTHAVIPTINGAGNVDGVGFVWGLEYETCLYYHYQGHNQAMLNTEFSQTRFGIGTRDFPSDVKGVSIHGSCQYIPTAVIGFGESVGDVVSRILQGSTLIIGCNNAGAYMTIPMLEIDVTGTPLESSMFKALMDNEEPLEHTKSVLHNEAQGVTVLTGGITSILASYVPKPTLGNRCVVTQKAVPYARISTSLNSQAGYYSRFNALRFLKGAVTKSFPGAMAIKPGTFYVFKTDVPQFHYYIIRGKHIITGANIVFAAGSLTTSVNLITTQESGIEEYG